MAREVLGRVEAFGELHCCRVEENETRRIADQCMFNENGRRPSRYKADRLRFTSDQNFNDETSLALSAYK